MITQSNGNNSATQNADSRVATGDRTTLEIPISSRLLASIPADICSDRPALIQYIERAAEVGVMAMAQAGVHLETDVVRREFTDFSLQVQQIRDGLKDLLATELTAEDSRLARQLHHYFSTEGKLDRLIQSLESNLADPSREASIPGQIKHLFQAHFFDASAPFQRALDISDDNSPLKKFVIAQQTRIQEIQDRYAERQTALEEKIDSSFEKIFNHIGYRDAIEESESKGTRKGFAFEEKIAEMLILFNRHHDAIEIVGDQSESASRKKVGDVMISVEQGGVSTGQIIVEVKSGTFTINGKNGIETQLLDAIDYRDAAGGIAVVTREHAKKTQQSITRLGTNRLVVVVDPEDEQYGFLPLEIAYFLMRDALVAAATSSECEATQNKQAIEQTISEILSSLAIVKAMRGNCKQIAESANQVRDDIHELNLSLKEKVKDLRQLLGFASQ